MKEEIERDCIEFEKEFAKMKGNMSRRNANIQELINCNLMGNVLIKKLEKEKQNEK